MSGLVAVVLFEEPDFMIWAKKKVVQLNELRDLEWIQRSARYSAPSMTLDAFMIA
jgi:hypothetical protein